MSDPFGGGGTKGAAKKKKDLKWKKIDGKGRGTTGKTLGVYGTTKSGKSMLGATAGFMNLKYADKLPKNIVKLLKNGALPEITKINIIDSEPFTWEDRILHRGSGDSYAILKPLIEDGVFEVLPVYTVGSRDKTDAEIKIEMFQDAVHQLSDDSDENTLNIPDSMSDYYLGLNSTTMVKAGKKDFIATQKVGEEASKNLRQQFWSWRNTQWDLTMRTIMRGKCWWMITFKKVVNSEELQKNFGSPPFKIQMVPKTEFLPEIMVGISGRRKLVNDEWKTFREFEVDSTAYPLKNNEETLSIPDGRLTFVNFVDHFGIGESLKENWW